MTRPPAFPPRVVAVIGSRDFPELHLVRLLVTYLPPHVVIASGHARGVDQVAERTALVLGHEVRSFPVSPALWRREGNAAYHRRNEELVLFSDVVFAFHDGRSRGTRSALRFASVHHRPAVTFTPSSSTAALWDAAERLVHAPWDAAQHRG